VNTYPYQTAAHEPTKKQLWLAAFTSLLCHMNPGEAIIAADEALELCDERWKDPEWVTTWQYKHNYAVGHQCVPINGKETPKGAKAKAKTKAKAK
jgi:hypothetical protein